MKKPLHLFYILLLPIILLLTVINVSALGQVPSEPEPSLSIHLLSDQQVSLDAVRAIFADQYSAAVCDDDSYKFSNPNENLAIVREGKLLSIESRPLIATDTLSLRLWKLKSKKYYLKITASSFPTLTSASIHDLYLNKEITLDLSSSTTISFDNNNGADAANRFSIVAKKADILPVMFTDVKAYQKLKGIQVDWKAQGETNILKYDVEKSTDGRLFAAKKSLVPTGNNGTIQAYSFFDAQASTGNNFYRIKVTEKSGAKTYSPVIKVDISRSNGSIAIFPNPVSSGVVGLQVTNLEKGTYSISVYNSAGLRQWTKLIEHNGGSATYSLSSANKLTTGLYNLRITKGEMVVTKILFVQ